MRKQEGKMAEQDNEVRSISSDLPDELVERIRELIEWAQLLQPQAAAKLDELFHDVESFFRLKVDAAKIGNIEHWRKAISEHDKENPAHGVRCLCMDQFARDLRAMLDIPKPPHTPAYSAWLDGSEAKIAARLRYILGMITRNS
jgi:predicted XRE-type DNA-binding protein